LGFSTQHPVLFFAGVVGLSGAAAALALWVLSNARTPFDYMVVGALLATMALAGAFGVIVLRTARKTGPRS
jgi:hypothetical protein